MNVPPLFSSTNVVAEKVTRQGLYNDYEVEINQETDDARSTFKSASKSRSEYVGRVRYCRFLVSNSPNVVAMLLPFQARLSPRKVRISNDVEK